MGFCKPYNRQKIAGKFAENSVFRVFGFRADQARQRYLRYRFAIDTLSVLVSIASINTESIRNRFFTAFPYTLNFFFFV
jgi:hypothetical protein